MKAGPPVPGDETLPGGDPANGGRSSARDTAGTMSQENVEIVRRYFQLIDRMLGEYWANPVPLSEYPEAKQAFRDVHADAEFFAGFFKFG